jgi:hypothetical protein
MEGFDKTGNHPADWKVVEDGEVYIALSGRQSIRNAVVEETIILYETSF